MARNITINSRSNTITVEGNCVLGGGFYSVTVDRVAYERWQNGTLIQNAFPNLSAGDREWLITGISPKGWDSMPKEEDEEDFETYDCDACGVATPMDLVATGWACGLEGTFCEDCRFGK